MSRAVERIEGGVKVAEGEGDGDEGDLDTAAEEVVPAMIVEPRWYTGQGAKDMTPDQVQAAAARSGVISSVGRDFLNQYLDISLIDTHESEPQEAWGGVKTHGPAIRSTDANLPRTPPPTSQRGRTEVRGWYGPKGIGRATKKTPRPRSGL